MKRRAEGRNSEAINEGTCWSAEENMEPSKAGDDIKNRKQQDPAVYSSRTE
jgi:hypothetical protein